MSPDLVSREAVHAALRADLPYFAVGSIVLVAGISLIALKLLRSREPLLLWVGMFSALYGLRLLLDNDLLHAAFDLPDPPFWPWSRGLTYLIPIPYVLFARELLGRGWKGSIVAWLFLEIAFACIAIPLDLLAGRMDWAMYVNHLLVAGGTMLILVHVFWHRSESPEALKSLRWPLLTFGVFVLLNNRGFELGGFNVEPVGFVILLIGLRWTAAIRGAATERKLIEVEQELSTARKIQTAIIPQSLPVIHGVHLAARYRPMTAVAGDFYDFLQTGEDRLTILVADVSGHGVPAALVSSMLKVCFAAQRQHADNPAEVLAGLNFMLQGDLGGQYVTAACAAIDRSRLVVTYAGAGHPPSLLIRKTSGEVVELAENGFFLGPFRFATYSNVSVPCEIGDRLILYTDGITEASPDGRNELGRTGLAEHLRSAQGLDADRTLDTLLSKIAVPEQQDDLTIVLAHFD